MREVAVTYAPLVPEEVLEPGSSWAGWTLHAPSSPRGDARRHDSEGTVHT